MFQDVGMAQCLTIKNVTITTHRILMDARATVQKYKMGSNVNRTLKICLTVTMLTLLTSVYSQLRNKQIKTESQSYLKTQLLPLEIGCD